MTLGWMLLAGLPLLSPIPIPTTESAAARWVTLWTDREDPYERGQGARVYLSTDRPAYVTVLRVDTEGRVRVLFPREPWGDTYVRDGRTFEVSGSRGGRSFIVDDYPGVGYLFAIASRSPLDYKDITRGDYWDYRLIEGGRIQGDPYVALTDLGARIAPGREYDYDIIPYYVERRYDYPRFVCYDCHAYASFDEWDPYRRACSRFRLVVFEDPRYYPYRRGRNVVADRPRHPGPRYVFRDADPASEYLTRESRRPAADLRRRTVDRGRTSEDVGGPGSIPTPGLSSQLSPPRSPLPEQHPQVRRRERKDTV
ncbi:MAG: DUF4384 domain-containing protein, partial [Gemmatimonadales bacterium]